MKRIRKTFDPLLRTQPWKIRAVLEPIESILSRLEKEGTVDVEKDGTISFLDSITNERYDLVAALFGVTEFFTIAERWGLCIIRQAGLNRLGQKLWHGSPVFESDIKTCREEIALLYKAAGGIRASKATQIIKQIQIKEAMDSAGLRAA